MSLPKLMIPRFSIKLPSSGKEVTFRPFLVKEEKALLMAVEARDTESMILAIKDAIAACVEDVDVSKLPYFDVEYLFLNLRAKSIGEEVKFNYRHRQGVNLKGDKCDTVTSVSINIDDVQIKRTEGHTHKIKIDDQYGIVMKYPTIDMIRETSANKKSEMDLMASCIESVFDDSNVYPPDSHEDAVRFIEQMNTRQYENLTKFFETMPKLEHEITYTCAGCGQVDNVKFEGVADFF